MDRPHIPRLSYIYVRVICRVGLGVLPPAWPESSFSEEDQKAIAYFGEHLQLDGEWHTDMQNKGAFRRAFHRLSWVL